MFKIFSSQKLRMLQKKLEEHEETLLGRAQVVDFLQQELTTAEQRNEVQPLLPLLYSICFCDGLPSNSFKNPLISRLEN